MRATLCCLLAFCYCCFHIILTAVTATVTEDTSIPQELIERLSNSEIRTMSDLQRILEQQFVDGAENEVEPENKWRSDKRFNHKTNLKSSHAHFRHRRSIEDAVPAACKTRTVVYEIPRAQVDPTAANFLIWPPCVEVTRCSGCCNTSNMRCHASKKLFRNVMVAKIEYVRRRPKLREVQVQLEDHLECVCVSKHHTESRLHTDIR